MKLGRVYATVVQKKLKLVEKQQILVQRNFRSFITVKAHYSMAHLKQQKSFGFF